MLSSGIDRRVGTAELARAAGGAVLGGFDNAPKALPAAVKAQAGLNDQLSLEVSRLSGAVDRLCIRVGQPEPACADASPRPAGLLSELEQEQARTGRLIATLGDLNDHLEKLI